MGEIEELVLKTLKPTEEDEIKRKFALNNLKNLMKGLDIHVGGSFGKGTWLRGNADIDVYVYYPKALGKNELRKRFFEDINERLKGIEYTVEYADNPFIVANIDGIDFDIVPVFKVENPEEVISPADRIPFYTKYINEKLRENEKDEARLIKAFMHGVGVYGSDARTKGFSGYAAELLTVKHKSFRKILEDASNWKPQVRIELAKPKREFKDPLVIIDEVDPRRNVGASVSLQKLAIFSLASRKYLEKPDIKFFFPPKGKDDEERVEGDLAIARLELEDDVNEDMLWGQVSSSINSIKKHLKVSGYKVIDVSAWGDKKEVNIGVQLESKEQGKYYKVEGPYFYMKDEADAFIKTNKNVWVNEDGRLCATRERNGDAESIIKNSIKLKYKHKKNVEWHHNGEKVKGNAARFIRKRPIWL